MKPFRLSRRTVLRGAGVSVALPWLEAMTPLGRRAQAAAAPPKRFVVFFYGNGHVRPAWVPASVTSETKFTFGRTLASLEPVKADVVQIDGISNTAGLQGPGDGHTLAGTTLLTGIEPVGDGLSSGGISIDQEIVNRTNGNCRFGSLEFGVQAYNPNRAKITWKAAGQAQPPVNSPSAMFAKIFDDPTFPGKDINAILRLQQERKSVLDSVVRNHKVLAMKLGADDRQKLEQHLNTISELETRLLAPDPVAIPMGWCQKPPPPAMLDPKANANFTAVGRAQTDLLVMALACDRTRVATLQWSETVGNPFFTWLGAKDLHHNLSHSPQTDTASIEMLTKIDTWYAERFSYLVQEMKKVQEADGSTLLDNSLVLWVNDLARGDLHSLSPLPFMLAGRAGGRLKTGRYLTFNGTVPHNNLLVSCLNAMDVPATTFGNPAHCTGALAGLL